LESNLLVFAISGWLDNNGEEQVWKIWSRRKWNLCFTFCAGFALL